MSKKQMNTATFYLKNKFNLPKMMKGILLSINQRQLSFKDYVPNKPIISELNT